MPKEKPLDWRKVEAAIIAIAEGAGYMITYERGITYLHLDHAEVAVDRLAKDLVERLS